MQAKGEALPLENESVCAVFLLFTLCFVNDPAAVLPEAKRVLKQYGALIAGIINKESPWGSLYERKKTEGHPLYRHARFYRVDKVEKLITDAGLSMETYSSALCLPPSSMAHDEIAYDRFAQDAGFVCMRARKL